MEKEVPWLTVWVMHSTCVSPPRSCIRQKGNGECTCNPGSLASTPLA